MSFEKPFRGALLRRKASYPHKQQNVDQKATAKFLSLAVALGAIVSTGSIALTKMVEPKSAP